QHPAIKRQAAHIKLDYLQFQELEAFTRFGARLEVKMQAKLRRGSILREMLKQNRLQPREETRLLAWLIAYNNGLLDDLDPHQARRHLENLGEQVHNWPLTLDTPLEQWQAQVKQWWADSGGRHEQTA
ncbi:MAG: hypothetical protein KDI21_19375, partial [Halieaceae bacterium]|nr:hypothetical protein [Halieaceae bacterium]